MKKYSYLLFISLAILLMDTNQVFGQQDPQYTQYMYNANVINPAYVGSRGTMNIFGLYRTQWVGLDGAPKTANLSISAPIGQQGVAIGMNFSNEQIGAMDENDISVDLSYRIDLNENYRLSFGLKGTANLLNVDYSKLHVHDDTDPIIQENISHKFTPNIGGGLYLYSDVSYLGLSIPNFLQHDRYDDNDITIMREKMHFYLMGGYVLSLNENIQFKPAFLVKAVSGAPFQVDLTANFLIIEKFTVGAAYRWDASISALAGFQINKDLFIGYSYDAETSKLRNYTSGTHEIFLKYELLKSCKKTNAPRFF